MADPRLVVVDFESFYSKKDKYTLRELSYPEFVLDSRFKAFGAGIVVNGGAAEWVPAPKIPLFLKGITHDIVVVQNAFFDAAVLKWRYHFTPAHFIDILQLANHIYGSKRDGSGTDNDLASLAARLGLEPKGRIDFMDGIRDPDVAQMAGLIEYAKQDARLEWQVLEKMLPQVSNPDFELWLLDHTIKIYTEKALDVDVEKLKSTQAKIEARRKEVVASAGVPQTVLGSNKQFAEELGKRLRAAGLKLPTKKPVKPRKDGITIIPALAKGDVAFQKLAEVSDPGVSSLVQARLAEKSAVVAAARLATMQRYVELGVGIPVHLVYYGAHTGRFAGGGGFNWQNLTSPAKAITQFEREVAALIRECATAGEGRVFTPTDAAQIEARVLAWLAGEQQILDSFANGADIYAEFISDILGETIRKPKKDDTPEVALRMGVMRQVGKESVLGLGFQMGAEKFYANVKNGGTVKNRALIKFVEDGGFGAEIQRKGHKGKTTEMAVKIVEFYRSKFTEIANFWYALERAFQRAMMGGTVKVGKLTFKKVADRAVGIVLPSGRTLYYRNLRTVSETRDNGKERKVIVHGNNQHIYGGLLSENVTQAVARDVLAEAIQKCEAAGYPVVLHIHDEIVPRVPKVQGEAALKFLIDALSTPPEWGKGLVLGAEGHITENLSK